MGEQPAGLACANLARPVCPGIAFGQAPCPGVRLAMKREVGRVADMGKAASPSR